MSEEIAKEKSLEELQAELKETEEFVLEGRRAEAQAKLAVRKRLNRMGAELLSEVGATAPVPEVKKTRKPFSIAPWAAASSIGLSLIISSAALAVSFTSKISIEGVPGWVILCSVVTVSLLFSLFLLCIFGSIALTIFNFKKQQPQFESQPVYDFGPQRMPPPSFDDVSQFEGIPVTNGSGKKRPAKTFSGDPDLDAMLTEIEHGGLGLPEKQFFGKDSI